MREWLRRFFQGGDNVTLTLRDQTFKKSDCVRLGEGTEKRVYKLKIKIYVFLFLIKWLMKKIGTS